LGAVPVYTETSQIADSLNKGTIDGALLAWEALESFQVTARYATDWGGNVTTFALVMNPATYDKLPGDLKALIDETTGPAGAREIGRMADHAAEGGHAYARRNGIEIIDLTPAERTAFDLKARDEIAKVIVERQGKGLLAREFVDDLKAQVAALGEGSGE
jgi:TRAP-type C4-dicarboxylate transport system substrate-binding protein